MRSLTTSFCLVFTATLAWGGSPAQAPRTVRNSSPESIKFVPHRIGSYRSEACGVGDFNNDGKLDIIAGAYLYLAPDWQAHKVRDPLTDVNEEGKGYCHDFANLPLDVDDDGRLDVVSCFWHEKRTAWFRNTGTESLWPETVIQENGNFECGTLADIDGDGDGDLFTGKRFMAHNGSDPEEFAPLGVYWYELQRGNPVKWVRHTISHNEGISSALNIPVVDLDQDGDLDVVVTGKWGGPVWFENVTEK